MLVICVGVLAGCTSMSNDQMKKEMMMKKEEMMKKEGMKK